MFAPMILDESASLFGIAMAHSIFNVLCTLLMMPLSGMFEKLVIRLVPDMGLHGFEYSKGYEPF
jgi:phosphate:Na+ symporter